MAYTGPTWIKEDEAARDEQRRFDALVQAAEMPSAPLGVRREQDAFDQLVQTGGPRPSEALATSTEQSAFDRMVADADLPSRAIAPSSVDRALGVLDELGASQDARGAPPAERLADVPVSAPAPPPRPGQAPFDAAGAGVDPGQRYPGPGVAEPLAPTVPPAPQPTGAPPWTPPRPITLGDVGEQPVRPTEEGAPEPPPFAAFDPQGRAARPEPSLGERALGLGGQVLGAVTQGLEKLAAPGRAGIPDPRSAVGLGESPGRRIARLAQQSMLEHPERNIFEHLGEALDRSQEGYRALQEAGPTVDPTGGVLSGGANVVTGLATQPLTTLTGLGGRIAEAGTAGGAALGAGYGLATGASPAEVARATETGAALGGLGAPAAVGAGRLAAPLARRLAEAGPVSERLGAVAGEGGGGLQGAPRRVYHGTAAAFDRPDPGRFDPDGLYGPGYYLTSDPRVASSYAEQGLTRMDDLEAQLAATRRARDTMLRARRDDIAASYGPEIRRLEELIATGGPASGPNVRAVDVPEGLNLLDMETPIGADNLRRLATAAGPDSRLAQMLPRWQQSGAIDHVTGQAAWDTIERETSTAVANDALREAGFDGITHRGGARVPLMDEAGRPIEHDVTVVFPESLDKIRNALSGLPGGIVARGIGRIGLPQAPNVAGGIAGGVAGYASSPETDTPLQRAERTAAGFLTGATGVALARGGFRGPAARRLGVEVTPGGTSGPGVLYHDEIRLPKGPSEFRWYWDRTRNVLGSMGEAGAEIARRVHDWRDGWKDTAGDWVTRMPEVWTLSTQEFARMVDVLEGTAKPSSNRVAAAAEQAKAVLDDVYALAQNAGVDVAPQVENYFPHRYATPIAEQLTDARRRAQVAEELMRTGQAASPEEARDLMVRYTQASRPRRHGALEVERLANLAGYEKTKEVLTDHLVSAAKRIHEVAQFGPDDAIVNRLFDELRTAGYPEKDLKAARNGFQVIVGAKDYEGTPLPSVASGLRTYNALTRLGWAGIGNATQLINSATVMGAGRVGGEAAKALGTGIVDAVRWAIGRPETNWRQDEKEFALRIGATLDSVLRDMRASQGAVGERVSRATMPGFAGIERANREVTVAAAAGFLEDMAREAASPRATGWMRDLDYGVRRQSLARQALTDAGLDADAIVRRGGVLEPAELRRGARSLDERTQFLVDPQDLPVWADSPWGKVVAQFRTFSYNQTAFVGREALRKALAGDPRPLVRFMILAPLANVAAVEARNLVTGREPEPDPVKRAAQYALGPLGIVGDVARAALPINGPNLPVERQAAMLAGAALGPSLGTLTDVAGAAVNAERGNWVPAGRTALRQIPVVGTTLQNLVLPYAERQVSPGAPSGRPDTSRSSGRPDTSRPSGRPDTSRSGGRR